jgi:hypothetical protein
VRRKPDARVIEARSSNNDKRRLREQTPTAVELRELEARASFGGYSKHKLNPQAFGLEAFSGQREDATYCDGHASFSPEDMRRVPDLLKRGITAGLIGQNSSQGDPTLLWTVDDNGWIYEARLTIPGQALYHGYPVLPNEAIARHVIVRYTDWIYDCGHLELHSSLQHLQERYS